MPAKPTDLRAPPFSDILYLNNKSAENPLQHSITLPLSRDRRRPVYLFRFSRRATIRRPRRLIPAIP